MNSTGEAWSGATGSFELGEFRVEARRNAIVGPAGETVLEPKIMAVLLMLAARPGEVVTRAEFLDTIWSREYSGDESLTRAISQLRKLLGNDGTNGIRIETITKTGYRLLVARSPQPSAGRAPNRVRWRTGSGIVLGALLAAVAWYVLRPTPAPDGGANAATAAAPVIAVLPFENQSLAAQDRFLADGLADELLSALTRSPSVAVIAGNTSFQFRGEDKTDFAELVRQLGVSHVVDGSVRRSPEGLRVGVHLIDARSGLGVWSEVVTRPDSETFAIPQHAADSILSALGADPLTPAPRQSRPDPAAYQAYLQARALLRESWPHNLKRATTYLEDAVTQDPALGEAWALLARARLLYLLVLPGQEHSGFGNRDPDERLQAARREAGIALSLDPGSIDAALALAVIDYRERVLTLAELERSFTAIHRRAPRHPDVNMRMGMMLNEVGRNREALDYHGMAFELDPYAVQAGGLYLQRLVHAGEQAKAEAIISKGHYDWVEGSYIRLEWLLVARDFRGAREWLDYAASVNAFYAHGAGPAPGADPERAARLRDLLTRLVAIAERGGDDHDAALPADLVAAADHGLILHYYAALLLGAASVEEPTFDLVRRRLELDDRYFRQALFRPALRRLREDPRVFGLFALTTQLDYWNETGNWPDFCADPALPYDCREVARSY